MIDEGKLWFVGGGTWAQEVARRECVTKEEAVELARKEHEKGGHFHHDLINFSTGSIPVMTSNDYRIVNSHNKRLAA